MEIHWTTKLRAVNETWARRCDKILYFISSPKNKSHDVVALDIPDKRQTLTDKTVFIHQYLYTHYLSQFDWFLKADDDTYVIMENLRFLLSHFDPAVPGYIGCQFKHFSPQGYMSGGAGYLFNREGLKTLVQKGYNIPARCRHKGGAEDIETGRCAYKAGVRTLNSLDVHKRSTFLPSNVFATMMSLPDWARNYMRNKVLPGENCCSELMVAFHYTGPKLMYAIDFLLYRVNVHGRRFMMEKSGQLFDGMEADDMERTLKRRPYPGESLDDYYKEGWRELNTTIYINPRL
ncbi:hypothetical protein RRG08_010614 [Elysia crispata]|uniref:N-acetylgalactosaminide beta-1,3-galactosyltransferase n=1 Tax=Elysia crispata TaxID=231223 RepID=A0AAE1AMK3_9GAST|nr:hypothetical protein RRG08_010614 [Elysia crispata]